jgi:hypothetical protein
MTPMQMFAFPFDYKTREYFSLVRVKPRVDGIKLEVTIMNGDLERLFYGHHVFKVDHDCVESDCEPVDGEIRELHTQIKNALGCFMQQYLKAG